MEFDRNEEAHSSRNHQVLRGEPYGLLAQVKNRSPQGLRSCRLEPKVLNLSDIRSRQEGSRDHQGQV